MNHSKTTISDRLQDLVEYSTVIDNELLIGEQVNLIHEAGVQYNDLVALITPDYLSDVEHQWLMNLGRDWNVLCELFRKNSPQNHHTKGTIDELTSDIQDALDELLDGFDGGDGIS